VASDNQYLWLITPKIIRWTISQHCGDRSSHGCLAKCPAKFEPWAPCSRTGRLQQSVQRSLRARLWRNWALRRGNLDFASADQAFRRAVELAPADPALLVSVGTQYYHLRRMDQAFACLNRAVAMHPSLANVRLILHRVERSRRLDEAWNVSRSA